MLTAGISYSSSGYRIEVTDVPLWAIVVQEIALTLCSDRAGHALCQGRGPFGWGTGRGLGPRLVSTASRRESRRWSVPVTADEVRAHYPELLLELDD
jgi:hypothetical protein